jgi:two-component system cell cycle response regulator DivK
MQLILVIEDQEQNLYLMKYLLESSGYRVVLARDGREGLDAANRERPDLILLDIQLPTMTGYEVARAIRAAPALAATPIVAVTSYAMPGDREEALASGCTGYIEKPIEPATFITEMERFARPPSRGEGGSE